MPVHIEEITADVAVSSGELPLTPAQVDKLVTIVMRRLDQRERERERVRDATTVRPQAAPTR